MTNELSEVAYFHKLGSEPDMNENHIIDKKRIEEEIGEQNQLRKQIEKVVLQINSSKLNTQSQANTEQIRLLEEKKETVKELLLSVFDKIDSYIKSIKYQEELKKTKETLDPKAYIDKLEESGKIRGQKHNALIDELKITIRFIAYNFSNNININALDEWQEKQNELGKQILDVEKLDLPSNIICPNGMDLDNRDQIADWAKQLYESLSSIKNKLSPDIKSKESL